MVSVSFFSNNFFIDDMELKIAGDAEERGLLMPLLYIDDTDDTK